MCGCRSVHQSCRVGHLRSLVQPAHATAPMGMMREPSCLLPAGLLRSFWLTKLPRVVLTRPHDPDGARTLPRRLSSFVNVWAPQRASRGRHRGVAAGVRAPSAHKSARKHRCIVRDAAAVALAHTALPRVNRAPRALSAGPCPELPRLRRCIRSSRRNAVLTSTGRASCWPTRSVPRVSRASSRAFSPASPRTSRACGRPAAWCSTSSIRS